MIDFKEEFLHYIWNTKNFDQKNLTTTEGQPIFIHSFGHHNDNAGPDFLNGRIEIHNTVWVGHIEIHLRASDWLKHNHSKNAHYQNVILHVVMEADVDILLPDQSKIACVELKSRINPKLIRQYQYLKDFKSWIPCEKSISTVSTITIKSTLDRMLAQRLTLKTIQLEKEFCALNNDLSILIYHRLAWAFGLKVNSIAMLELARSIPYSIIHKHGDNLLQIEALLFGQSGLLPTDTQDSYILSLKQEYSLLKTKFRLVPLPAVLWKFSRLRPSGFPTLRIAQFARLLGRQSRLDEMVFADDIKLVHRALDITLDGYWDNHYRFGPSSSRKIKKLGAVSKTIILTNAIVPIIFMYGRVRQNEQYKERALTMLESMKPEQNSITNRWYSLGLTIDNAADSQALIQLKKSFCEKHLCLNCPIGHQILMRDT